MYKNRHYFFFVFGINIFLCNPTVISPFQFLDFLEIFKAFYFNKNYKFIIFSDARCFQIRSYFKASVESAASHVSALRSQALENSNQILGSPVEKKQHEDNVGDLPESSSSAQRRLGVRQR